jgi:hypothetical protein
LLKFRAQAVAYRLSRRGTVASPQQAIGFLERFFRCQALKLQPWIENNELGLSIKMRTAVLLP